MPRYGDPDYDPDYDDSPPATPKYRPPPPPQWKVWFWRLRRNRSLIIFSVFFFYTLHFLRTWRRPILTPKHAPELRYKNVDWRWYAYSQYATNAHHLCNSVMLFDQLERLGSKAERILMYPREMDTNIQDSNDRESQLLVKARDEYGVHLYPIELEGMRNDNWNDPSIKSDLELSNYESYDTSISKFLTFNQTRYLRILHIDSDSTVLKNMDDLFLLPEATVAMPRAYWRLPAERALTPQLMLVQPSSTEWKRLMDAAEDESRTGIAFDREILNQLYRDSALVLPHRAYGLQSSEFRAPNHTAYHGNDYEVWHPDRALAEASLVHFADHPLPKPWIMWPAELFEAMKPPCEESAKPAVANCRNQEVWLDLYRTFRKRRKEVCGLLSVPAPQTPVFKEVPLHDEDEGGS